MANYVLEILDGDRAGEVLPVADQPMRFGRKPGNDVVLADEKTSGVHCEIVREGDRHVLRDLGSTNGTFLDGKRVTELVLTPGDVVTVGRTRVCFRSAEAASDAGDLAVHRLDAARLKKRGGSVGLVVALLVVAAAGGGWFWWQNQATTSNPTTVAQHRKPVLDAPGNKLPRELAGCEVGEGWELRAAGSGFQPTTNAHTGEGAFEARLGEGETQGFALAQLAAPLPVFVGRTLTVVAHVRSEGDAQVAVRAHCSSSNDSVPFRFRHGTKLAPAAGGDGGWQRLEVVITVPGGCDRLQVEVLAQVPTAADAVQFDDVAVLDTAGGSAIDLDLAESNQKALGTGSAVAVRSTDADNPATLLAVLPAQVPAALEPLRAANLLGLSDLGIELTLQAQERSFALAATGVAALELVFPAEAAAGLMGFGVQGGEQPGEFRSVAAESEFTASGVLLGDRATRAMVQFAAPVACAGKVANGLFRLRVQSGECELVLGFRSERQEASVLLRAAKAAAGEQRPGVALDTLRALVRKVPQDSALLAQAQELRAQLLSAQADAIAAIAKDLDEAAFFNTRGGFARVVTGIDDLKALYGEHNLEGAAAVAELRQRAASRLATLDGATLEAERVRLQSLAEAFAAAEQPGLAELVQNYLRRRPSAATTESK